MARASGAVASLAALEAFPAVLEGSLAVPASTSATQVAEAAPAFLVQDSLVTSPDQPTLTKMRRRIQTTVSLQNGNAGTPQPAQKQSCGKSSGSVEQPVTSSSVACDSMAWFWWRPLSFCHYQYL